MVALINATYVRPAHMTINGYEDACRWQPSSTMSSTAHAAPYYDPLYSSTSSSAAVSYVRAVHAIDSDDEDGHRLLSPTMSLARHPRTLHLPAVSRVFKASRLLTPGGPDAMRVDLSINLETFIHYTSKEPATTIPNLKRMALTCRDLVWAIYVDAQPGARTVTVQDVIRAVYSNLRMQVNGIEAKHLRGEQQACLHEARVRRLGKWLGDEKPGHTFYRRVDVLNRRTLFVGIRPSSSRSGDGSTMEWSICLEAAEE